MGIPFKMPDGTPPFVVVQKEEDHPFEWNTSALTIEDANKAVIPKHSQTDDSNVARSVKKSGGPVKKSSGPVKKRKSQKILPTAHVRHGSNGSLTRAVTEAGAVLQAEGATGALSVRALDGKENAPVPNSMVQEYAEQVATKCGL